MFTCAARDKQIALMTEIFPDAGQVDADADRMQLVLANLIGIAIRYTPAQLE